MKESEIRALTESQRTFFESGKTLSINYRIMALQKLYTAIKNNERSILDALREDLGKGDMEAFMCEVGLTMSEITYMLKHVKKFAAARHVMTPITNFHSNSIICPCPYGNVLIMSPWNYPFLLSMEPLVDAIAAGNTVILKVSAYSPKTSEVIKDLIEGIFPSEYVAVVDGGREENSSLLSMHFDKIFFTGSQAVGREVLKKAADNLTPVTLELGGKSPCIVDNSADIKLAARRIVFGKFLNCGQTCVAPDHILCDSRIKDELVARIKKEIIRQFGRDPLGNKNYGKIINRKHFDRLLSLMDKDRISFGGGFDEEALRIEPTLMDGVTFDDAVMQEEIFGPLLPVLTYDDFDLMLKQTDKGPHPLALYIFSNDNTNISKALKRCRFGGGCINDVVVHLATPEMPFGGFGESGMGAYHGRFGFETFSHQKSILDKKQWLDLPMRYQPYRKIYEMMMRIFLK